MKKTLTKILAVLLSVCMLLSTPVFTALADESDCPVESISLTLNRPMYENVDGHWERLQNGESFFYYDFSEYIRSVATVHINYKDGTSESGSCDELSEKNNVNFEIGHHTGSQYQEPWYVGYEVDGFCHMYHRESNTWIYYDVVTTIEETPIESITAEATKSLIENITGEKGWHYNEETGIETYYYKYDIAYTEPTFTVNWKDPDRADSVVPFSVVKKMLYTEPQFFTNESEGNEWSAGTHTATASIFGVECDFEVTVISQKIKDASMAVTYNAILGVDGREGHDPWNDGYYHVYGPGDFDTEVTLVFENDVSLTIPFNDFYGRTNEAYQLRYMSNQSYETPWAEAGDYSFDVELWESNGNEAMFEFNILVTLVENPVEKITASSTMPVNVNNFGYRDDGEGEYKHYYGEGSPTITVYYTNGTVSEPMHSYELSKLFNGRYTYYIKNNQGYGNEWQLGKNTASVEFMGRTCEYDVYLTDSFVKEVKVLGAKTNTNNGWHENGNFIYNPNFPVELELTLWNDTKVTTTMRPHEGSEYGSIEITHNQETNPWTVGGVNEFTLRFCDNWGKEITTTGYVEIGDFFEYQYYYEGDGVVIQGFSGKPEEGVLEIPEEINGYPVIGVSNLSSNSSYENNALVKSVIIPDSVSSFSDYSLTEFENLETLKLGKGVSAISEHIFTFLKKLKTLEVSAENENYYSSQNAIYTKDKTRLVAVAPACDETIILPAECTDINVLFAYADAYKNVKIGYETEGDYLVTENGITYSKDKTRVIYCDKDKEGAVVLPETVTSIAQQAFANCNKITSVTIPNGVTSLVYGTFLECTALENVTLPNELETIGSWAFAGCKSLASVDLPNNLFNIEYSAFENSGIEGTLTIPNSVEYIGGSAFSNTKIETVKIGSGVQYMVGAFRNIPTLKSVNIPAGVTDYAYAFSGCTALTSVTLEDGLECIDYYAFENCSALTSISIPNSVTGIWDGAFSYTALEKVTIPDSVTYLGAEAFMGCQNLTSANIGDGVDYIGKGAFAYTGLNELDWGEKVETIGPWAFEDSGLESIEIPNTVTSILYAAFENSENLSNIKIPDSVVSIGAYSFDNTAWYIAQNKGNTYIDNILYRYKGDLTAPTVINIKEGTRLIADGAFEHMYPEDDLAWHVHYDLSGITEINIPNSVKHIGNIAFANLPNITEIKLPDGLETIGYFPFEYCEKLTTVDIGLSTADFDFNTFAGAENIKNIIADPQNTRYKTVDGVLYNKDMTELIYCPPAKTGDLYIPASVTSIATYAFVKTSLNSVIFKNSNTDFRYNSFMEDIGLEFDDDTGYYYVSEYGGGDTNAVLKAESASYVEFLATVMFGHPFEAIKIAEEQQSGITVMGSGENAIPDGAELVVESVLSSDENTVVFDITLESGGASVQPNAPVTVRIPLPAGFDAERLMVYRLEEDGSKTNMNATTTDGYIYFTTDHFSLYSIEMADDSGYAKGDIDGNGVVTVTDLNMLKAYLAGDLIFGYVEENLDVNGDGSVDQNDVTTLSNILSIGGELDVPTQGGGMQGGGMQKLPGDADGNGVVNLFDLVILTQYLEGNCTSSYVEANLDVNGDGVIDLDDSTMLSRMLSGWSEEVEFTPGDIDGNGQVNLFDLVTLSRVVAEWEDVNCVEAALDPNGDGVCDLHDITFFAQYLAGWHNILSKVAFSK